MSFQKLIQYKTLNRIYGSTGGALIDQMAQQDPAQIEKMKMRNVCALISVPLFERLEEMCGTLSLSKREFIESALIEALDIADKVVAEEGLFDHWEKLTAISDEYEAAKEAK